ncbi:unnamed protein product [Protopolystoma xenopodis]|uniref:Uncharacterized protein n=1 Tax=Protopolystoma xenopodis TaxID=117903 RepID=A0A448WIT2_9PLAT|nr:unnamed protein product [Protopolystoma xenopodis]
MSAKSSSRHLSASDPAETKTESTHDSCEVPVIAKPTELRDLLSAAYRLLSVRLPSVNRGSTAPSKSIRSIMSSAPSLAELQACIHIYLANPDTEAILMRRIEACVLTKWAQVAHLIANSYSDEERMIIACPSINQVTN